MATATLPESYADLFSAKGVAILTTNGPSGYPQTSAVAYMRDEDGLLKLSLNTTRQKTKNLTRDPRATLFFIDPGNPYRTIEIRADVELVPDADKAFAVRAGARYGSDFTRHDGPGEERVIVILHPVRVNTWGDTKS